MEHPWLNNGGFDASLKSAQSELSKYNARRRLRKTATAVVEINRLRKMWGGGK